MKGTQAKANRFIEQLYDKQTAVYEARSAEMDALLERCTVVGLAERERRAMSKRYDGIWEEIIAAQQAVEGELRGHILANFKKATVAELRLVRNQRVQADPHWEIVEEHAIGDWRIGKLKPGTERKRTEFLVHACSQNVPKLRMASPKGRTCPKCGEVADEALLMLAKLRSLA